MHDETTINPLRYLFSKTWRYSAKNRKRLATLWIMFVAAQAIELIFSPLAAKHIFDRIPKEGITHANIRILWAVLGFTVLIKVVFWALHGPSRIMERNNAFGARANYRKYLLGGVMVLPIDWHTDQHSGAVIDKIEKGTLALFNFSEGTFQIIYAFVQLGVSYSMLVYFSHSAAYIVLAMMAATIWITTRFDEILIAQYRRLSRAENNVSESVFDAISNITTVIILRVERLVFEAIVHKIEEPRTLFEANSRLIEAKWFMTSMCCAVMSAVVLGFFFYEHIGSNPVLIMGSLMILYQYLGKITELFYTFTEKYGEVLKRKAHVLNSQELANDFKEESFANHVLPKDWQMLSIEGLNFSYEEGENATLNLSNIWLSIRRGERIAFVGESGGGKTTLLKLIRDLYHPHSITLRVDGMIISEGFAGIARAIALIPQETEIFATTILKNITLGAEYTIQFILRFTDMACFTAVALKLPQKFESSIKEKGVNLSGGQKQRLALARGLLACHGKDIILLDEPTSSTDTETEFEIHKNIFEGFPDAAIISSTHRLHLLPLFDRVYVIDKGKIIAAGTVPELLRTCRKFQELWRKQNEHPITTH